METQEAFKTVYCHMIHGSNKQKRLAIRQDVVKYAQQYGIKPTARRYGCSKNTVRLWLTRYREGGIRSLRGKRPGPRRPPNRTLQEEEQRIIACRQQAPCYGPKRLRDAYGITASEGAIARVVKEAGLVNKRRKKYQRKQDLRAVKGRYRALTHHQMDVKHLYDIPYYWDQLQDHRLPRYEWTLRDTKSGFTVLGFAEEYSELHSTLMITTYLDYLKAHGIDTHEVTIQTDNGTEFGGTRRRPVNYGFVHTVEQMHGAHHQFIPPGMCNANADVESFHNTVEKEFFDLEAFSSKSDFWCKAQAFQLYYNAVRINYSKGKRSPLEIIATDRPYLTKKVILFPVINVDDLVLAYLSRDSPTSGGQVLTALPDINLSFLRCDCF